MSVIMIIITIVVIVIVVIQIGRSAFHLCTCVNMAFLPRYMHNLGEKGFYKGKVSLYA